MATSVLPFPVSPLPTDFRNSSWGRFPTARIRAFFYPAGLILAALVMLVMGFVPWATSSIMVMFVLLFLCGWFQGMGWPPCGRTMVHWWSQKERGGIVSVWNCAHNVGGGIPPLLFLLGMAWFNDWHAALYMPAFGAILLAIFAFAMMRDTPQSCGLPPIEEYKNDYPDDYSEKHEEELTAKQIFMQYILPEQAAVVHRRCKRVCLPAALRHS
ncbi:glycerol-3-phosphate transporter [Klebsiella oxytoca]|nr:glycerol-3-phosphate transporter [Klebsiella oxytoca]